jgi:hypothetical protein
MTPKTKLETLMNVCYEVLVNCWSQIQGCISCRFNHIGETILKEAYIKFHFTVYTPSFLFLLFKPIHQTAVWKSSYPVPAFRMYRVTQKSQDTWLLRHSVHFSLKVDSDLSLFIWAMFVQLLYLFVRLHVCGRIHYRVLWWWLALDRLD